MEFNSLWPRGTYEDDPMDLGVVLRIFRFAFVRAAIRP
jgi:hypothetical protein